MRIPKFIIVVINIVLALIFLGDVPKSDIVFLAPLSSDSVSYDPGKVFIISTPKDSSKGMIFSSQWEIEKVFNFSEEDLKADFAKDFYRLFDSRNTVQAMTFSYKVFKGFTVPESLTYSYFDSVTIRTIWQKPEFASVAKKIQLSKDISQVLVTIKGWSDSLYTTDYDDPNADGRLLYKIHTHLLPGINNIYCSPAGMRKSAVEYTISFRAESVPVQDRADHFHNSVLEQSCSTCHEGLPSASEGVSMKADCNVCHKAMSSGAIYLHSPAEMKECESCHSWSAEKKTVVVEKGVPTVCYDCHNEKQAQVENSVSMHPVAGECATCHSTHGTDQKHILKEDVYTLCTSCHNDQKMNHPVGRHPLRFAKLRPDEEISCVSCHNPHGSENASLLKAPGGRMEICEKCH